MARAESYALVAREDVEAVTFQELALLPIWKGKENGAWMGNGQCSQTLLEKY